MSASTDTAQISRRNFLRVSAAVTGGLLLEITLPGARSLAGASGGVIPNAFIRIARDGSVTLVMHKVEMGQGVYTAFSQLIAEELEVSLEQVRLEHAPPDTAKYGDPMVFGAQMTGGSTSMRGSWNLLREAGAAARVLLIQAAAQLWTCDASMLVARDGRIHHPSKSVSAGYGELVDIAATLPVSDHVTLKDPAIFRVIGKPVRRLDGRGKVDGTAQFGIDVKLPGMKFATVAASPVFGGTLAGFDQAAAMKIPGVRQVVRLLNAVAVVADHLWAAKQGLAAAAPRWSDGQYANSDMQQVIAQLDQATRRAGAIARNKGNPIEILDSAAASIDAVYQAPFLAHATMEPINCTAEVRAGEVDVWVGTQVPAIAQAAAAQAAGVTPDKVRIHNHLLGGGFGRRLEIDFIRQAVLIARQVAGPVKVVWSREEDIQHDMYRPYYFDRVSAVLDNQGLPQAWVHRMAGSSILARFFPAAFANGVDLDAVDGATELPYTFPHIRVEYARVEPAGIPTAFWRGVGPTHNGFVVEGFIDELAAAAKRDPLEYRRALVRDERALKVLNLAAAKSDWGKPQTKGEGRGIALMHVFGSYIAQVAEVQIGDDGDVHVRRVVCAIDCGLPVNPSTIVAQMEGGIVFGLSAALWGEITIAAGRVQQSNFHDYRVMRINETPRIEVHIVPSAEPPSGVGEPGTSLAIPALVNAVYAATGKRIRKLPIGTQLSA